MGFGYGSNYADVISEENVKKICPKEYKAFIDALEKEDKDLYDFAIGDQMGEETSNVLGLVWNNLCVAFRQATTVGNSCFDLNIGYHDKDSDGDRYDEVDGYFFSVDGAYQLSPAGEKFEKIFDRKFFVTAG